MAADKAGVQNWIRKITGSGPSPLGPGYVPESEPVPEEIQRKADAYKQVLVNMTVGFHEGIKKRSQRRRQMEIEMRQQGLSEEEIRARKGG